MASKFKAPLNIQFEQGQNDFKRGRVTSRYKYGSDRHKEWERGFNKAYFDNKENYGYRTDRAHNGLFGGALG